MIVQVKSVKNKSIGECELQLVISSDQLMIPLKDNITSWDDLSILLEGNDNKCFVIEGTSESIYNVIDKCYEARRRNTYCNITLFDNKSFILKFK